MQSYFGHIFLPKENDFQKIEGVRLFMDGDAFWIEAPIKFFGVEQYNLITGVFNGFGSVTLIECNIKNTSSGSGGNEGKLSIHYILCGIQINNEEKLNFSGLSVKMPALKKWIDKTVFKDYLIIDEKMSIEYPDTISFGDFDKYSLEAFFGMNQNQDSENSIILKEYVVLKIKTTNDNLSLWEFLNIYREFKKFLAFIGVFDKNVDTLSLFENTVKYRSQNLPLQMRFYISSYNFKNAGLDDIKTPKFDDVEANIKHILQKWFRTVDLSDSINLILEKYFQTGLSRETFFLNSCFAIEIYHRRFKKNQRLPKAEFKKIKDGIISKLDTPDEINLFENKLAYANEPSFKERLESLKEDFQIILPLTIDMDNYIKQIVNTRNNIVHRSSSKNTLSGLDIYYASVHLEALTKLCVYRELGFSQLHILKMFVHTREQIDGMYKLNKRLQTGINKD
jgi:hypothetical protein